MIKACSFLPAATQIIYDLGLEDCLQGVTFECPLQARSDKQIIVHCALEGKDLDSQEIDRVFSVSKAQGRSLYFVDEERLATLAPDIIFTQDVCEVCLIDTTSTQAAVARLAHPPQLIPLSPQTLDDAFEIVLTIWKALGHEESARQHLTKLHHRLDHITKLLQTSSLTKRVMLMEWLSPIYNCGHWIPDQITHAGGNDGLANPRGDSRAIRWNDVVCYNPEVLVIAPCGFSIERTRQEMSWLTEKPEWPQLQAVKNQQVYLAGFDLFTQPSASTLVDGIELLTALFHPEIVEMPEPLRSRYQPWPMNEPQPLKIF
uniref:ABC transporter substrate-binding protein n=1 Tax=Roseihalotalea indica TaxID=2867963 RepID=A0AA49GLT3_9BACT|nr:ABC transporter substrate-binding protein [Tunicatimonas sp. TK19036]